VSKANKTTDLLSITVPAGMKNTLQLICRQKDITLSALTTVLYEQYLASQDTSVVDKQIENDRVERIGVLVNPELADYVGRIAKKKGMSMSAVYRAVLTHWLHGESNVKPKDGQGDGNFKQVTVRMSAGLINEYKAVRKKTPFNTSLLMNDLLREWIAEQENN